MLKKALEPAEVTSKLTFNPCVAWIDNLAEVQKKIDSVEEKYYLDSEMPTEVYEKLRGKLAGEKTKIEELLVNTPLDSSNLKNHFDGVVDFSLKLATVWSSAGFSIKEKFQKIVFPDGISYNFKTETFRTITIRKWFEQIPHLNCIPEDDKNWTRQHFCCLVQFSREDRIRTASLYN